MEKLRALIVEFIVVFYLLQALGPAIDSAFLGWVNLPFPFNAFGEVMRLLAPSPEEKLLAFIETLLITISTAIASHDS